MKAKAIYLLYRAAQAVALPLLVLYFLYRGFWDRGYWSSLTERFGFLPPPFKQTGPGAIWLHAVSVGEVASTAEFVKRLRCEFPSSPIFVSAGTIAGKSTAEAKLGALADGIFYAPVDYVFAVRRVLRTLRPSVVVIAETEIWPNLFRETKRLGAGLMIVNGRISDRAFSRYRRFCWFFQSVLPQADMVLAQSAEIAHRFAAIGVPPARLQSGGNFKYDSNPAADMAPPLREFLDRLKPAQVWIAASTMPPAERDDPDEDDAVISAFLDLSARHPGLLLILVPRKPAAFDTAAEKLNKAHIPFVRRTQLSAQAFSATQPKALLLDTIGELGGIFRAADVVFMGGTLAHRGGHNILEAAFQSKPVVIGPHMENFRAIADDFRQAGAVVEIAEASELASAVHALLTDPERARSVGRNAELRARASSGASARAAAELKALYTRSLPWYRPALPWYPVAWLLSRAWALGGVVDMRKRRSRQKHLDVPVVSVGNISMGGTGKTPCVIQVAELLRRRGFCPGIVTRGYGRVSPERLLALEPGQQIGAQLSGDEAQILIRSGVAPVGIGASRHAAANLLRRKFDINTLVLDDGFQHVQLARDLDIVLLDALNPFSNGNLFPLGRLREPPASLARAGIILMTRVNFADTAAAIEYQARRWNPDAPIFRARVEPMTWIDGKTGAALDVQTTHFEHTAAFCGLGNPSSFRRSLTWLGIAPAEWIEFDDHHHYRPHELRRMAYEFVRHGVETIVTTEKDAVNLCEGAAALLDPLRLYYLKVKLVIEREDEFADAIISRLRR